MANDNRLGRGLDALFAGSPQSAVQPPASQEIRELTLEQIVPNAEQARKFFDEGKLAELAASIKEQGIIQPLLVSPNDDGSYSIVAGERRWRAARLAGLASVPVNVVAKDAFDRQAISLIENLQREDLNPMEEANGIYALMDRCNLTQEQAAQKLGKSRSAVANAIRLRGLPEKAQEDLQTNRISAGHARGILAITDAEQQESLRARIVEADLTVRQVEDAVTCFKENGAFPWDMTVADKSSASSDTPEEKATPARTRKDPSLNAAAKRIAATLNCKAKISGDLNKCKITLHYDDTEMLEDLLTALGAGGLDAKEG